jgi:hypothetical protein
MWPDEVETLDGTGSTPGGLMQGDGRVNFVEI